MIIHLFDDKKRKEFLPLTFTRPLSEIRVGIDAISEKWHRMTNYSVYFITEDYLSKKYPSNLEQNNTYINGRIIPDNKLVDRIATMDPNSCLFKEDLLIAVKSNESFSFTDFQTNSKFEDFERNTFDSDVIILESVSDIFHKNGEILRKDFKELTEGKVSVKIDASSTIIGNESDVFIENGAVVLASTLNTSAGPIYIGKDALVMEGSMVRGPFALCEESTLKMGCKIYGPTTIGPHSKVGGEVNNSVLFGYSNKAHDGFLGNAVIGEWCNLGADTNNSNLKNNYAEVKLWDYETERFKKTGLTFCGLILGDHSKSAINTQFNTGTVVGVCSNIFGAGFPRNFIPSFSWGGANAITEYSLTKVFEVAKLVYERRNRHFDDIEKEILTYIFDWTAKYRR